MIAVDTNILVYAHREELEPEHEAALAVLRRISEGSEPWGLPVFCVGEFVRVVSHPKLFDPPSTLAQALGMLHALYESPTCRLLMPQERYVELFEECLDEADARGNLAFDAQIAALCLEHGARQILTLDRDFRRFERLEIVSLEA